MNLQILFLILLNGSIVIQCFEEIFLEISFAEEQENGTLVVDLREKISSLSLVKNSKGYKIKFVRSCLNLYFDEKNLFKILSVKIDREEICQYEINCSFICNLILQKEEIKLIKLKVNIEDINDHQPKFNKKNYFYEIENKENLSIQLEEAEDKDFSSQNSIENYYLNSSSIDFPFQLNYNKENHFLQLILINNQFKQNEYLFQLFVLDGQNQTDFCFIQIKILENSFSLSPRFDFNLYKFFIFNLNQTFIGQVKATNSFQQKQQIYYRLISSTNLFQIDELNGKIYLKNNKEIQKDFYEIFIEAFYLNYISSLTTVHIYFNLTSSSSSSSIEQDFIQILIPKLFQKQINEISLKENSSVPLTILQIFVSSSTNLQINSSINYKEYFYLKQLDEQSLELILFKSFDYEIIQQLFFQFYLQNSSIEKSIKIFIENLNDCQPYFQQQHFHLQLQENNQIPFLLYTFQAFDNDQLNNIFYQIKDLDQDLFSINSTNGQFNILKSFDREFKSNYSFSICAFDQIYETCSTVYLQILDQNDNICQFNSSTIHLNIDENILPNTNIIQIQAFDPDFKQNGTLYYSFTSPTSYFKINSTSGLIQTTTKSFDYEFIQFYSIIIQSCDNIYSFPSFCCSIQLYFNIQDLDDHFPYLIFPSDTNQIFIIDYTNQTMPQLKANDQDLNPKNRFIFFEIIGGSLNSSISIDYYSGKLNLLSTSPSSLPIYGTLQISISSKTIIQLNILIHNNQTNPQLFLKSIQKQQSFQLFYFIFISFLFLLILLVLILIFLYFWKDKTKHNDDELMNTPSTTTLSTRSLSTSNNNNKKICETYYSFGDSFLSPQVIYL